MKQLVFFLEGRSEEAFLQSFLPRVLAHHYVPKYIVFQGKQAMDKDLVSRLRGYRHPNAQFVIMRDQDSDDCKKLKKKLFEFCLEAKKPNTLIRIACRELESWYLADLNAVAAAFKHGTLTRWQKDFDLSDRVSSPARRLQRILPTYQKIGGSRLIGRHLDPTNQRSSSFASFVSALKNLNL